MMMMETELVYGEGLCILQKKTRVEIDPYTEVLALYKMASVIITLDTTTMHSILKIHTTKALEAPTILFNGPSQSAAVRVSPELNA